MAGRDVEIGNFLGYFYSMLTPFTPLSLSLAAALCLHSLVNCTTFSGELCVFLSAAQPIRRPEYIHNNKLGKGQKPLHSLQSISFGFPKKRSAIQYIFFSGLQNIISSCEQIYDIYILEKKIRDVRSRETQNCNFQFRKTRNVCIYFFFLRERGKTTQEIRSATHREFIKFSY